MRRGLLIWLAAIALLSVIVAVQVTTRARSDRPANADVPTRRPGLDLLAGIRTVPVRVRDHDYQRAAFGDAWDDDTSAPGGRNGCDTRNDVLDRDLVDKTYVSIKRCADAVASGTLHDPYTNETVAFIRGNQVGATVQIDHIVPLAYAWDMGAREWPADMRLRFANDPANLLAVSGRANQDKGDQPPGSWMPENGAFWCQYSIQFADVLRGYGLAVDEMSADELRKAAASCPVG
jgi:hypothetical protein